MSDFDIGNILWYSFIVLLGIVIIVIIVTTFYDEIRASEYCKSINMRYDNFVWNDFIFSDVYVKCKPNLVHEGYVLIG